MTPVDRDLREAVEQFLILESSHLDEGRWDEWQGLFAPDGTYWMPLDPAQPDPINHVSLIYDDRTLMDLRCRRLRDGGDPSSLSLHPFPRTLRFLSNVTATQAPGGGLDARAKLMAVQHAAGLTQTFFGSVRWLLSGTPPQLKILQKRVDLLTAGSPLRDILVYL